VSWRDGAAARRRAFVKSGARATGDHGDDDQYDDDKGDDDKAADDGDGGDDDGGKADDDAKADDGEDGRADDESGGDDGSTADDAGSAATCSDSATCPTPRYYESDTLLGECASLENCTGLDDYERLFFHPVGEWTAQNFSVRLNFNDDSCEQDIFYFCHVRFQLLARRTCTVWNSPSFAFPTTNTSQIHQFMSGRIKLLQNGVPISDADVPEIPYEYDQPGEFDVTCGTYGLDGYQLPNSQCPVQFVCGAEDGSGGNGTSSSSSDALAQSAKCYDAFNCAMMAGMTTRAESGSELALFIHQYVLQHVTSLFSV
jgi:hypothetical protein